MRSQRFVTVLNLVALAVCAALTVSAASGWGAGIAAAQGAGTASACPKGDTCVPATYSGSAHWSYPIGDQPLSGEQEWTERFTLILPGGSTTDMTSEYESGSSSVTGTGTEGKVCSGSLEPLPAGSGFASPPALTATSAKGTATFVASSTELSGCGGGTLADGSTDGVGNPAIAVLNPTGKPQGPFASQFSVNIKRWLDSGSASAGPTSYSYTVDVNGTTLSFGWTGSLKIGNPCDLGSSSSAARSDIARAASGQSPIAMYVNGTKLSASQKTVIKVDGKELVAGEQLKLAVECDGTTASAATWKIEGDTGDVRTSSVLGSYRIQDSGPGSSATGSPIATSGPRITVHFMHASETSGFDVSVTADGTKITKTFVVQEPTAVAEYRTCRVDLSHFAALGGPLSNAPTSSVGPGRNRSCILTVADVTYGAGNPGIAWRYAVRADDDEAGTIAMVQLISTQKSHNDETCENVADEADLSAFYDSTKIPSRAFIHVGNDQLAYYWDRDSPGLSLIGRAGRWYESFYAQDYLMWRSDMAGSVWVPLGGTEWSWYATVARANKDAAWRLLASRDIGRPSFTERDVETPVFSSAFNPVNSGC